MKKKFKTFGAGMICLLFVFSCSTNDMTQSLRTDFSNEKVEIVANPYVITEANAIDIAFEYTDNKIESIETEGRLTIRSSVSDVGGTDNRRSTVTSKNFSVRIEELSSDVLEVKQEVTVYTINFQEENGKNAGFVVMVGTNVYLEKYLFLVRTNTRHLKWT